MKSLENDINEISWNIYFQHYSFNIDIDRYTEEKARRYALKNKRDYLRKYYKSKWTKRRYKNDKR